MIAIDYCFPSFATGIPLPYALGHLVVVNVPDLCWKPQWIWFPPNEGLHFVNGFFKNAQGCESGTLQNLNL